MIEILNLTKTFDDYDAAKDVTLRIEAGHIYGLVGTNGSGKSTLLRCVSGIYKPEMGISTLDGENTFENVNAKSRIFFVSDDMFFQSGSTLMDAAKFYKSLYPTWSDEVYRNLIARFPLNAKKNIKTFSKGMVRQAALILGLSCQPDFLLLDEAFDGLDPVIRVAVRKLISDEVSSRNMGVVIASHNLRELEDFCDVVGILHSGKLVLQQNVNELSQNFTKAQVAFKPMIDKSVLEREGIRSIHIEGSMATLIAQMTPEQLEAMLQPLNPIFTEYMPLSLEEIFIYEMEAVGYDYTNILF